MSCRQEREEIEKVHKAAVAQLRADLEAAAACTKDMQEKADAAAASASQQQAALKSELAGLSSENFTSGHSNICNVPFDV